LIYHIKQNRPKTQIDYEIIKGIIRRHSVLRWGYEEISRGFKTLIDFNGSRYKYTIEDAVQDKGQINVEGIYISEENKYVDCSNFFVLEYSDEGGKRHLLNLSDEALYDAFNYRDENLKQSTYTLMYSKLQPNLFKAVKRLLSYGKMVDNLHLIEKVYGIINSQLGNLYNATSQLKTVSKILKDHGDKKLFYSAVYHTLEMIGFKLQEIIFLNYDINPILDLIMLVLSDTKIKESDLMLNIDNITHDLIDFINKATKTELMKVGLYPLPNYLTPKNKPF
jgi:hypothetical protein